MNTDTQTLFHNTFLKASDGEIYAVVEAVVDAIEETFLSHLPTKALSYCAQEDVNAGLDALRERFGIGDDR